MQKAKLCLFLLMVCPLTAQASLVGYWPMDEGQGTILKDMSGNGHDGTITGTPTWVEGPAGFHRALQFSSSGASGVNCGRWNPSAATNRLTVALWICWIPGSSQYQGVVVDRTSYSATTWCWSIEISTTATTASAYFGSMGASAYGLCNLTPNQWQHLVITFDGSNVVSYLDGVEKGKGTAAFGSDTNSTVRMGTSDGGDNLLSGLLDDVRIYDTILTPAEIVKLMSPPSYNTSANPTPADKATDVPRNVVLSWEPGENIKAHDVYLGTSFDDVNSAKIDSPVCVSKAQDANAYVPPVRLDFNTTYYWRVDEVNDSGTTNPGSIWKFTTEPIAYPIDVNNITATASASATGSTPRSTIDKSGLTGDRHGMASNTMWITAKNPAKPVWLRYDFDKVYKLYQLLVWNSNNENELELNYGLQNVTIEYTSDGTDWTKLGDYVFNQATATEDYEYNTVIDFGGITAQSVKITAQDTYGGSKYGLAELRFLYIPVWAREPKPATGSNQIDPTSVTLSWRAGREADSQKVYLGTDPNALTVPNTVTASIFAPAGLNVGVKYYWRVDEVNAAETPSSWTGAVWDFTTSSFRMIEGFEGYDDKEGTAVFNTWTDGYGTGDNGGQIGYDIPGPYMEKIIRHGGDQSTPFYYKNAGTPGKNFSEATRTFDTAQDWTIAKADTLRLWVRGRTADVPTGSLPAATTTFDITSAGTDVYQATDQFRFVYRQLTGDGSITAKIDYQQPTHQSAKAGVMIRVGTDAGAMQAYMATLPGAGNTTSTPRQVEWSYRTPAGDATARSQAITPTTASTWVRVTRKGDVFTGEYSADGLTWVNTSITTTPQTIVMGSAVNVGLIVCSHVATTAGEAKFSNVKTTGNVTGEWQKIDIGITSQPVGNTADTFYVAVADNAGKTKTVVPAMTNPVCTTGSWQSVDIPFSQFTGVNMASVKSLTFGVGDKTGAAPQHGAGLLYIDDIGVGHPTP